MSHMEPMNSSDDVELPQDVPAVLRVLHVRGMRFTKTAAESWSMKDERVTLRKTLSVYFVPEVACGPEDILLALGRAGGDTGAVTSIQRRFSSRTWVISFATLADKEWALNVGSIDVCQTNVTLVDVSRDYTIVKIYDAPAELPDTAVIGRLSAYGQVVSFRRDRTEAGVENGSRTARVCLDRVIPPSISVVGELIKIWYPDQPKLCRKCGASDHLARACNTPRCANCEAPGHQACLCPEPPLCALCVSSEHSTVKCPFLLFSCNVKREDEGISSAEESVGRPSAEEVVEREAPKARKVEFVERVEFIDTSSAEESVEEESERTKEFVDLPSAEFVEREAPKELSVDISSGETPKDLSVESAGISSAEESEQDISSAEESERLEEEFVDTSSVEEWSDAPKDPSAEELEEWSERKQCEAPSDLSAESIYNARMKNLVDLCGELMNNYTLTRSEGLHLNKKLENLSTQSDIEDVAKDLENYVKRPMGGRWLRVPPLRLVKWWERSRLS